MPCVTRLASKFRDRYTDAMDILVGIQGDQAKLRSRREALMAEVASVDAQLAELEAAARIVSRYVVKEQAGTQGTWQGSAAMQSSSEMMTTIKPRRGSQKQWIEAAMVENPKRGWTVPALQAEILAKHGVTVSPNTVSVTLSRLAAAPVYKAHLIGRNWFYGPAPSQEEAAEIAEQSNSAVPETPNQEEV